MYGYDSYSDLRNRRLGHTDPLDVNDKNFIFNNKSSRHISRTIRWCCRRFLFFASLLCVGFVLISIWLRNTVLNEMEIIKQKATDVLVIDMPPIHARNTINYETFDEYKETWGDCKIINKNERLTNGTNFISTKIEKVFRDIQRMGARYRFNLDNILDTHDKFLTLSTKNGSTNFVIASRFSDPNTDGAFPCICTLQLNSKKSSADREIYNKIPRGILHMANLRASTKSEDGADVQKALIYIDWIKQLETPFWFHLPSSVLIDYDGTRDVATKNQIELRDPANIIQSICCFMLLHPRSYGQALSEANKPGAEVIFTE